MKSFRRFIGFLGTFCPFTNIIFGIVQYKVRYMIRYNLFIHMIRINKTNLSYYNCLSTFPILGILQVALLIFSSCSLNVDGDSFSDKKEAISGYEEFLDSIESDRECSFEELPGLLNRWKSLEDTLFCFLSRDTTEGHINDIIKCSQIGNRVNQSVNHIIDGQVCNLKDLIKIQYGFPVLRLNKKQLHFLHESELYFSGMDSIPVQSKGAKQVLKSYRDMLGRWLKREFRIREDVMSFLKEEDYMYRMFLCHLYEYSSHDMIPIIRSTESLLVRMAADVKKYTLDWDEVSTYMAVRTNRRLIQNTAVCLSYIDQGALRTERQAMLTVPMLLNPYADFNQLVLAMRTSSQYDQLLEMSENIPRAIHAMEYKQLVSISSIDSLSNKLIKEYIAFVMNH